MPNRVLYEIGQLGPDWLTSDQVSVDQADTLPKTPDPLTETTKPDRWTRWADTYVVPDFVADGPIPLFETDDKLRVELTDTGRLKRSAAIDERIRTAGKQCVHADGVTDDGYEGLLYIMYQLADDDAERPTVVPRYIGKAEAYGKKRELSSNFEEIAKDRNSTRSFARWGDGNSWHVGELSMALFEDDTRKLPWASELFEQGTRRLKQQTYLWTCAWNQEHYTGPYGYSAYLAEVEPQLIGVAQAAYPEKLLNKSDVPDDSPIHEREYQFESASH